MENPNDDEQWRNTIKNIILYERNQWLQTNSTKVNEVHMMSVSKILHLIPSTPSETLKKQYNIIASDLSFLNSNSKASTIRTCPVKNVWLTGFLRFGPTKDHHHYTLFFEDSKTKIPVFFYKRPSVELLDGLLLVKDWQFVYDKLMTPSYLEVKAFKWIQRREDQATNSMKQLFDNVVVPLYTVHQDAPLYTGFMPWQSALDTLKETGKVPDEPPTKKRKPNKKRKKIHVVYGRLTCKSPVSQQKDPEGCHFFVEIQEAIMDNSSSCSSSQQQQQESLVQVMFVGQDQLKWYFFLHVGMEILVTDLGKVFSKECDLFLLQSTSTTQVVSSGGSRMNSGPPFADVRLLSTFLQHTVVKLPHVLNYRGQITKIMTKDCFELDNGRVLLFLVHFPLLTPDLLGLRVGQFLQLTNTHVLNGPLVNLSEAIALGLCVRSGLEVIEFQQQLEECPPPPPPPPPPPSLSAFAPPLLLKRMDQLFHIDFKCLPLQVAAWFMQTFHTIVIQIHGRLQVSTTTNHTPTSQNNFMRIEWTSIKKRHLVKQISVLLGFVVPTTSTTNNKKEEVDTSSMMKRTLGSRFLLTHQEELVREEDERQEVDNSFFCMSVANTNTSISCSRQLMSIKQMGVYCRQELTNTQFTNIKKPWSIVELDRVYKKSIELTSENTSMLIAGFLEGNIESGDLFLVDATGKMNLKVDNCDQLLVDEIVIHANTSVVYFVLTKFKLIADMYTTQMLTQLKGDQDVHFTMAVSCDAVDLTPIFPLTRPIDKQKCPPPATTTSTPPSSIKKKNFYLLVTQVDTCKKNNVKSNSTDYRHLHGIAVSTTMLEQEGEVGQFEWTQTCQVELVLNLQCPHWFVQSGRWYFIKEAIVDSKSKVFFQQVDNLLKDNCCCPCSVVHKEFTTSSLPLEILRVEPSSRSQHILLPVSFELTKNADMECTCWTDKKSSQMDLNGLYDFTTNMKRKFTKSSDSRKRLVSSRDLMLLSVLTSQQKQKICEKVLQVRDLFIHPFVSGQHFKVDTCIHSTHYISVMGVIVSIGYIKRPLNSSTKKKKKRQKRPLEEEEDIDQLKDDDDHDWILLCRLRDLHTLDYVDVQVSMRLFGPRTASLQNGHFVLLKNLMGFISRSKYKVSLEWSHRTSVHHHHQGIELEEEAHVLYRMKTTFLHDMYLHGLKHVDRSFHRWLVQIVHLQYFVLKRKCLHCHQMLRLNKNELEIRSSMWKRSGTYRRWTHPSWMSSVNCPFVERDGHHHQIEEYTYVSATLRCLIDDGTGQAELYVEDNLAWDFLGTALHQRKHMEKMYTENVHLDEWTFFANNVHSNVHSNVSSGSVLTSFEYYQNVMDNFILACVKERTSPIVVIGRRFWKKKHREGDRQVDMSTQEQEHPAHPPSPSTSVLTLGQDVQIITNTLPMLQLEAVRVDNVHVRQEVTRLLKKFH